jgi:hypothetical protein
MQFSTVYVDKEIVHFDMIVFLPHDLMDVLAAWPTTLTLMTRMLRLGLFH